MIRICPRAPRGQLLEQKVGRLGNRERDGRRTSGVFPIAPTNPWTGSECGCGCKLVVGYGDGGLYGAVDAAAVELENAAFEIRRACLAESADLIRVILRALSSCVLQPVQEQRESERRRRRRRRSRLRSGPKVGHNSTVQPPLCHSPSSTTRPCKLATLRLFGSARRLARRGSSRSKRLAQRRNPQAAQPRLTTARYAVHGPRRYTRGAASTR